MIGVKSRWSVVGPSGLSQLGSKVSASSTRQKRRYFPYLHLLVCQKYSVEESGRARGSCRRIQKHDLVLFPMELGARSRPPPATVDFDRSKATGAKSTGPKIGEMETHGVDSIHIEKSWHMHL